MFSPASDEAPAQSFRFRVAVAAVGCVAILVIASSLISRPADQGAQASRSSATRIPLADLPELVGGSSLAWQKGPGKPPPKTLPQVEAKPVEEKDVAAAAGELQDPPLFDKWPEDKLQAALLITGNLHGYMEPCGCAGLENQKGGFARRHTFFKSLEAKGWNILPLDVGNHIRRQVTQSELKFSATAMGLRDMNYGAIGVGYDDLRLPSTSLINEFFLNDPRDFVSANVTVLDPALTARWRALKVGPRTIGVTQVLSDQYKPKFPMDGDVKVDSARTSLQKSLNEMKADKAKIDFVVVLFYGDEKDAFATLKGLDAVDLLVVSGEPVDPHIELKPVPGSAKAKHFHAGQKGMHVGVVGLFNDAVKVRYQRVPLDSRFEDSKDMLELMKTYQKQLEAAGLDGLNVNEQPHPSGAKFVGSETCGTCHTKAFAVWRNSPHAHATESLIHPPGDRPARHFDPECLACHVTGWNPEHEKWYPFESGYLSLEKTPHLRENGCENCHGPGSEHVKAETDGAAEDLVAKFRKSMKLPLAGDVAKNKCMECHDLDNSPKFHDEGAFERYWEEVKHEGKD